MELLHIKTVPNAIDQAGGIQKLVENLFYGWGYNAYRKENQLRADDLLIRSGLSDLLGQCRESLRQQEMDWRREHLPPPTREHPYPNAESIRVARHLESQQKQVEALEIKIRTAPVPEKDRVWQRHRKEGDTLEKLAQMDQEMATAIVELLHACQTDPVVKELDLHKITGIIDQRNQLLSVF